MKAVFQVRTIVFVEVRTVGFTRSFVLKRTVGINATHAISRSRRRSHLTPMANTVPKWSEVTANLIFGWTPSVHHASRTNGMAHVLLVEVLRTCKNPRLLLRQWTGEWTCNMVWTSSMHREEMFGPPVGIKWVQHRAAHVITSIRPRRSQGGRIRRLPVASDKAFLFADGRFHVMILLLKLPEFVYRNWTVTLTNTHDTSVA